MSSSRNTIALILVFVLGLLLLSGTQAYAASCLGKKAKKVSKSGGKYVVKRNEAVLFTGTNVRVEAAGDTRICSGDGNINLTFEKGNRNQAALGGGSNTVYFKKKANQNFIRTGSGKTLIKFFSKANKNIIRGGSGDDTIVVANKSNLVDIDAGDGNNKVFLAARASAQSIRTGKGNDIVVIQEPARTNKRTISTGLGNDDVNIIAKGHTTTYLSPKTNPAGLPDVDTFSGGPSNDTVYDYSGGTEESPNRIYGNNGFDKLHSYGDARTNIYGGDGTDWLYSASSGVTGDRIFGDRGNDKLFADRGGTASKAAFLVPGEGDDWIYGTPKDDTIIALSGIKKVWGNDGDDTIIKTGDGIGTISGGAGYDTISYIGHTPPGFWTYSGIKVDLGSGEGLNGKGIDTLNGIEHLIGSPFDDWLIGDPGAVDYIDGGLGNDEIEAQKGDEIDGGLGINECSGASKASNCNDSSPGQPSERQVVVDIGEESILTVLGSQRADDITVGYDYLAAAYTITLKEPGTAVPSRDCFFTNSSAIQCPAPARALSSLTVDGSGGDDAITIDYSVPAEVSTIVNGGEGNNVLMGGKSRDYLTTSGTGSSQVHGRDGGDQLYLVGSGAVYGGAGSDAIHLKDDNTCRGGLVSGGSNKDNVVFAGSNHGVKVDLGAGRAVWNGGVPCARPLRIAQDFENVESSKYNDDLTGNKGRRTGFLGRNGIDTFRSKNGIKDVITTGDGGRQNKIIADRFDKIIYGWGLAAY